MAARFADLTGRAFGRLVAVSRTFDPLLWNCKCECGATCIVAGKSLRSGNTKSCGCLRRDKQRTVNRKHGKSSTRTYSIWKGMIRRCHSKTARVFQLYGAKGIIVCDAWRQSFEAFYADMGDPPTDSHEIDRVDNSKGYSKDNCRWATPLVQTLNRGKTKLPTSSKFKGVWKSGSRWAAGLRISGKSKYLGSFGSEELAARAYDKAAREVFGEYASLNFQEQSNGDSDSK